MRKLCLLILIIYLLTGTVSGMEYTAPSAPDSAQEYMPKESESFGKDLLYILKSAIAHLRPEIAEAAGCCLSVIAVVLLISLLCTFSGISRTPVELVGTIAIGLILIGPSNTLVQFGVNTVVELSEYGKLLLPVMTGAMAAEGGVTGATAIYTGTVIFNTILSTAITKLVVPMLYIYITLCIACNAIGEDALKNMCSFVKWLMTWTLKILLYAFTSYMAVTKVISGTTDAAAMKATKLAISGVVPVVGNIISDASETILVSASLMKNAAGIYGSLAILAAWIGPFLQISLQYIFLKITASVCGVFGSKGTVELIKNFSEVMGFLLAMTGTVCLLLLIGTVCFMKGVS